jgi:cytochrome c biogenesis protein CcmG/thiol:disulfide interchange protein DsbE
MSVPAPVLRAATLVKRHKLATGIVAAFAVVTLGVSLATTGAARPSYPAAPAFSMSALGDPGQHISLSGYRGKPLIVNLWASWCYPCQTETPLLASWYRQQHGHVILVGLDENDVASKALSFAHAKGVSYPLGFDPNLTAASAFGVNGLPQTFFLNARHQIVYHVPGAVTAAELAHGLSLMTG